VLPLQTLYDTGFRPCAVAVDAGDNSVPQRRDIPVVTDDQDSLEGLALCTGIPIINLSRDASEAADQVKAYSPDIVFVSCFARKLPAEVLSVPSIGCFNLHPSLLPAYRGPSPIFWQFRDGVSEMGVTLHRMSVHLDGGDIIGQNPVVIPDGVTLRQASVLLAEAGGQLFIDALSRPEQAGLTGCAQREEGASYQGFPSNSDYTFSTDWSAKRVFNFIRATQDQGHVYHCTVDNREFELVEAIGFQDSGEVQADVVGDQLVLPCRPGFVRARFLKV